MIEKPPSSTHRLSTHHKKHDKTHPKSSKTWVAVPQEDQCGRCSSLDLWCGRPHSGTHPAGVRSGGGAIWPQGGSWLDFWWFNRKPLDLNGILMGFNRTSLDFYGLFYGMYFWSGLSYEAHFGCPLDLDCKFLAFTLSGKVGGRRPKASDWLGGPKSYLENHVNIKIGKQKCSKTCSRTTGGCKIAQSWQCVKTLVPSEPQNSW